MWRVIQHEEKHMKLMLYSRKLAEIDYMLFVIDKDKLNEQKELYRKMTYSELKVLLEKRLIDFAESEIYRDFNNK